jgi:hypothetical protein
MVRAYFTLGGRTHVVEARVYDRREQMIGGLRRCLKSAGVAWEKVDGSADGAVAGCMKWPWVEVAKPLVATLLFSREDLSVDTVVHECQHGGWALVIAEGAVADGGDEFEELVVTRGAELAEVVLKWIGAVRRGKATK